MRTIYSLVSVTLSSLVYSPSVVFPNLKRSLYFPQLVRCLCLFWALLYCHRQISCDLSFLRNPPEQHSGVLLKGDWAWHPAPALSCFVWGRVPVSGTTISGARPRPLITEQSWTSVQAVRTRRSHSLTICSASALCCAYKIQHSDGRQSVLFFCVSILYYSYK